MTANIDSDHRPLRIKRKFALKYRPFARPPPPKPAYHMCTDLEARCIHEKIQEQMSRREPKSDGKKRNTFVETMREATEMLLTKTPKLKNAHYSKEMENILKHIGKAVKEGNIDMFAELTKQFRKSKQDDNKS